MQYLPVLYTLSGMMHSVTVSIFILFLVKQGICVDKESIKCLVHPKLKIVIIYSYSCNFQTCMMTFFCRVQKKIFCRMLVAKTTEIFLKTSFVKYRF